MHNIRIENVGFQLAKLVSPIGHLSEQYQKVNVFSAY